MANFSSETPPGVIGLQSQQQRRQGSLPGTPAMLGSGAAPSQSAVGGGSWSVTGSGMNPMRTPGAPEGTSGRSMLLPASRAGPGSQLEVTPEIERAIKQKLKAGNPITPEEEQVLKQRDAERRAANAKRAQKRRADKKAQATAEKQAHVLAGTGQPPAGSVISAGAGAASPPAARVQQQAQVQGQASWQQAHALLALDHQQGAQLGQQSRAFPAPLQEAFRQRMAGMSAGSGGGSACESGAATAALGGLPRMQSSVPISGVIPTQARNPAAITIQQQQQLMQLQRSGGSSPPLAQQQAWQMTGASRQMSQQEMLAAHVRLAAMSGNDGSFSGSQQQMSGQLRHSGSGMVSSSNNPVSNAINGQGGFQELSFLSGQGQQQQNNALRAFGPASSQGGAQSSSGTSDLYQQSRLMQMGIASRAMQGQGMPSQAGQLPASQAMMNASPSLGTSQAPSLMQSMRIPSNFLSGSPVLSGQQGNNQQAAMWQQMQAKMQGQASLQDPGNLGLNPSWMNQISPVQQVNAFQQMASATGAGASSHQGTTAPTAFSSDP